MEVEIGGRVLRVDLRSETTGWQVDVGTIPATEGPPPGQSAHVRVAAGGTGVSLLVAEGPGAAVARSHDVVVDRRGPGEFVVHVGGRPVVVRLPHLLARTADRAARGAAGGVQRIVAGIPGRIVRVLVRPGDVVQPRQPVIVVEAMKMQNELRATHAGTVTAVQTVEGALVDAGTLLVEIGPLPPQP